jgi:hypothetical protein
VKGGFVLTSGNSQATNGVLALTSSRKEGNNKLSFDATMAYGRSNVLIPVLADPDPNMPAMPPTVTALGRRTVVSTNNWLLRGRYDRFITTHNSAYASGQAAADRIAGKEFFGGGQVGYSRQLLKTEMHTLVAELGYDYSYEDLRPAAEQDAGFHLDPLGPAVRRGEPEADPGDRRQRQRRGVPQPQQRDERPGREQRRHQGR